MRVQWEFNKRLTASVGKGHDNNNNFGSKNIQKKESGNNMYSRKEIILIQMEVKEKG
ncbi:MAG: hypothetical protein IPO37_05125 [Saprospiraceae bacterium]|nr:hypothetical protein [Saprospiraceae bacterium]